MRRTVLFLATALTASPALAQVPGATSHGPFDTGPGVQQFTGGLMTAQQAATLAAAPSAYLGEVATRATVPNGLNSGLTQALGESFHIMRDDAPLGIRVVFWNGYVNVGAAAGTSEETGTGTTATYTAALDAAGTGSASATFPSFSFGGTTAGTVANGALLVSDVLPTPLKNGQKIGIRQFIQNAGGIVFRTGPGGVFLNDLAQFGSGSLTDLTTGGAIGKYNGTAAIFPVAIIANTSKGAVCEISDSRVEGVQDARSDGSNDGGEVNRFIGPRAAYLELGSYGEYATKFAASDPIRQQLMKYCRIAVNELTVNDLAAGTTAVVAEAARVSLDAQFVAASGGGKVLGATLVPYTSSSDSWATVANQSTTNIETARQQINTDIRNGLAGESGLIDVDRMIDPTATGKWPANGTAKAYTPDGIHETTLGAMTELQSGLWNGVQVP